MISRYLQGCVVIDATYVQDISISPRGIPVPGGSPSRGPSPQASQPQRPFLPLGSLILHVSCKWNPTICGPPHLHFEEKKKRKEYLIK